MNVLNKELLIFSAIAIAFVAVCLNLLKVSEEETVILTEKDYISKNGKYRYEPIKPNTLNYIRKFKNGRIYNVRKAYPKVVIYTNVVDTKDTIRLNFQDTMKKYSKSNKWKKGYSFENFDTHMIEELYMTNREKAEYNSFTDDCDPFCIVDIRKKLIFKGIDNSDKYVQDVLSAFYNN